MEFQWELCDDNIYLHFRKINQELEEMKEYMMGLNFKEVKKLNIKGIQSKIQKVKKKQKNPIILRSHDVDSSYRNINNPESIQ